MAVVDSGCKWTMMRHGNRVKHLGRPQDQRKALIRGLVTQVILHGQIRTTKVTTRQAIGGMGRAVVRSRVCKQLTGLTHIGHIRCSSSMHRRASA